MTRKNKSNSRHSPKSSHHLINRPLTKGNLLVSLARSMPSHILGLIFLLTPIAYYHDIFIDSDGPKAITFYLLATLFVASLRLQDRWQKNSSITKDAETHRPHHGPLNFAVKFSGQMPWLVLFVLLFIGWMFVASFFALVPRISFGRSIDFMAKAMVLVFVWRYYQRLSLVKVLFYACIGLILVSSLGILQYFGLGPDFFIQKAAPAATFVNKNHAAHYIGLLFPASLAFLLISRKTLHFYFAGLVFWASLTYTIFTHTRGLWVAIFIGTLFFLLITTLSWRHKLLAATLKRKTMRKKITIVMAAIAAAALFSLLPPNMSHRGNQYNKQKTVSSIFQPAKGSARTRIAVWLNTSKIIKDYPLTGVGPNGYQILYPLYSNIFVPTPGFGLSLQYSEAHNDYIQFGAETGLPGLLLFSVIILFIPLAMLYQTIRNYFHSRRKDLGLPPILRRRMLQIAFAYGLVNMATHALFEFPTLSAGSGALFWPWLGLAIGAGFSRGSHKATAINTQNRFFLHKFLDRINHNKIYNFFVNENSFYRVTLITLIFMLFISIGQSRGGHYLSEILRGIGASEQLNQNCPRNWDLARKARDIMPFYQIAERVKMQIFAYCNPVTQENLAYLEASLESDPFYPNLWLRIIEYRLALQKYDSAFGLLSLYREMLPHEPRGMVLLGQYYLAHNEIDKASELFSEAIIKDKSMQETIEKILGFSIY